VLIFLVEMKNPPSLPKEFEERMRTELGNGFDAFLESLQKPSPVSIRLNPNKVSEIEGDSIPWTNYGKYLTERPIFTLDPALHAGAYYVQEASSMLLEQAFVQSTDLTQSLRILDLSAAPGGKSTHILSLINTNSLLVSNEVIRSRASILSENIQKWGHANVVVTCNDPTDFKRLEGFFDVILVDAPCSGEGLFRKDPDAMNEWSINNVQLCSQRQRRILSDVLPALKEGGILIYSTCTFNEQENENNLIWLAQAEEVEFIPLTLEHSWGIETIQKDPAIGYRCYPHKVKGEGFFISVLRKKTSTKQLRINSKKRFTFASKKIAEQLKDWMLHSDQFDFIQQENLLIALPISFCNDILFLHEHLHVVTKGTAVAEVKHDKLIPEHAVGLSIHLNEAHFQKIKLTLDQALLYLRKEVFVLEDERKGFALVKYKENSIGWVNLLGHRFNNLYPSAWRIRMGLERP
jgi:16S rRNA C967 or C1407 C5-methylase (RsmB/RsmF family)/NOL1/NOP2/fmu family ribosome biogenesis protein